MATRRGDARRRVRRRPQALRSDVPDAGRVEGVCGGRARLRLRTRRGSPWQSPWGSTLAQTRVRSVRWGSVKRCERVEVGRWLERRALAVAVPTALLELASAEPQRAFPAIAKDQQACARLDEAVRSLNTGHILHNMDSRSV